MFSQILTSLSNTFANAQKESKKKKNSTTSYSSPKTSSTSSSSWEDKLRSYQNDSAARQKEIERTQGVINKGGNTEAANRWLNQLNAIGGGMNTNDVISGKHDNYNNRSWEDKLRDYSSNGNALNIEKDRTQNLINSGKAQNMEAAQRWLNQLNAIGDGMNTDEVISGKHDNYINDSHVPSFTQNYNGNYNNQNTTAPLNQDNLLSMLSQMLNESQQYDEEIYDRILDAFDDNRQRVPDEMTTEESYDEAGKQLNPIYDQTMRDTLKAVDKNNLARGFFGQMPGAELERSTALDLEDKRSSAISQLASALKSQDQAHIQQIINNNMQNNQQKLSSLLSAINTSSGMKQNKMNNLLTYLGTINGMKNQEFNQNLARDQFNWNKDTWNKEFDYKNKLTEAEMTGYFGGEPTMAYTKMYHDMGIQDKNIKLQEKQINDSISRGWESIKNSKAQLAQAERRLGLEEGKLQQANQNSYNEFLAQMKKNAFNDAYKLYENGDIDINGLSENTNRILNEYYLGLPGKDDLKKNGYTKN